MNEGEDLPRVEGRRDGGRPGALRWRGECPVCGVEFRGKYAGRRIGPCGHTFRVLDPSKVELEVAGPAVPVVEGSRLGCGFAVSTYGPTTPEQREGLRASLADALARVVSRG